MAPDLTIELASREDVPRIVELSNDAVSDTANFATEPEPLEKWLAAWEDTRLLHPWLVARAGGAITGFAKSSPHRARGAYAWTAEVSVYVDRAAHGGGVGTALYAALIPILEAQGYMLLLAGITDGHAASERLHARAGFARCGTFHAAGWKLGRWIDVGYWELLLRSTGEAPREVRRVVEVWTPR